MKRNLLKTSLVTLGLVWGMGSAFAQEQATLYSLNFDNLSETPTDWDITAGTLSLETDGTNKFLKQSTAGTGSRGAWYTGSAISSAVANVDNWTISFDCLIAEGTNTGNYSQGVWILGSDLSNTWGAPTTPLAGVVKGSNADSYTLQVNGAEAETGIQLTSNQYYHYTYSYDKTTKILSVTIQDTENTVVYEKNDISYDYETSTIGDLTSIFIQAGRNSSGSASETNGFTCIDNILLTTKSNQEIVAAPLASVTAINGVSRTITITPQDASHTVFYYIGEDSSNPTEYTEPVVISETGTLHYYAQSASGATSTVQSLEVNCVEVVLAAPTFLRTGADSYEITATQSATDGLTPVATIHYTIAGGEEQTIASGSKISGVNGDITAWAVAEGYTNSEVVTETYVAPYETENVWSYDLNSFPSTYSITAIADAIDESTETTLNELTVYNLVNIERPDLYVENSEGWLLRNQARNAFKIQNSATSITFNNVAPGNLIYINGVDDKGRNRITNIVNGEVAYSFNNSEFFIVPNTAGAVSVTFNTGVSINEVAVRTIIGGETPQGETATFDFNANEWGLPVGNEGNIGDRTIESGGVVASFTDGGTPTRMWGDAPNTQVRIYAENPKVDDDVNGTMTLTAPDGKVITKVEFDATDFNFTVTDGTLEGTTWTGNASAVTFTTENGQTRLNKVVVTVEDIPIPEVQNLAALKAMEETGTEVKLILNDTKITVMEQSFLMPVILIEDASGAAVQIPAAMGMGDGIATMFPEQFAKAGVALNGYLYCAYDPSMGGMIMPSENTANSVFTATDTEITPTVMTIAEANTDANANRFIQLQNVEINEGMIEDGENSIAMQDMLGVMTDPTTGNITVPEGKININGFMLTMDGTSYTFIPVGNPPYTEVTDPAVPEVQNLAALKAMEETGTEVKLILNDTKVTILSQTGMLGPVTIIEDASGAAVQLPAGYGIDGDGIATMFPEQFAKAGVALNGYLYCAYDPSMGGTIMPSENTANSEFTATDTEVTPTVMTIAEASTDANANRYIQLQNVEINESYEIVDGESSILMQDLLGAMTDMTTYETVIPEGKININGFIMTMDPGSYWFVPVGNPPYTEIVEKPEPSDLRVWDFTKWSDATVDNLEAEAVNHTDEPAPQGEETGWRRYEKDGDPWEGENGLKDARTIYWYGNLISEPTELKANGETIEETAGLLFNNVTNLNNTVAIAIDYPSAVSDYDGGAYLWLNGADLQFTIQSVQPGQKVLMEVESHRDGSGRGVSLSVNGTAVGESAEPSDGKVSYEWTIPAELGTEPVDVLVTSTAGCHIYRLEVGNADLISVGINEVNAENGVQNDNVYTINGVMVRKAGESLDGLAKGLYIIGGKKVVIK